MPRFSDVLPDFAKHVEDGLRVLGKPELADQIPDTGLLRWTYTAEGFAGFIYLQPSHELNIVERNVIRRFYSHSVEVEDSVGMVMVDVDNLDRITGIEVLNRSDVFEELARRLPAMRADYDPTTPRGTCG